MRRIDDKSPEATLSRIVDTLPERTEAPCPHFGLCGGCQIQHVPYDAQLIGKRAMLINVLQAAGIRNLPEITTHAADAWAYRNRARFRVHGNDIGYSRRNSNDFLAIETCPIASPLVAQTAFHLRDLIRTGRARWPAQTEGFEVFVNHDESAVQLSLLVEANINNIDREAPRDLRTLCDALQQTLPQIAGAGLLVHGAADPKAPRRVQENIRIEIARWGDPGLGYTVRNQDYLITRGAFFQVNRYLTATMVDLVLGDRTGHIAWDIFAGAGLFSVPLTHRFQHVVAVEIGEPAATDLIRHLAACGPQHTAVKATAADFLSRPQATKPDLIVLDPPRAGIGLAALQGLMATAAREVVYVSCDAGTFARDAYALIKSGYSLAALHLLDLFPQTFHTETIAVFRR